MATLRETIESEAAGLPELRRETAVRPSYPPPSETGPDDHPFVRSFRDEGRAEGRVEGRDEGRAKTIRQLLLARGIEVSAEFPDNVPGFAGASEEAAVAAALGCGSERDFRARISRHLSGSGSTG